MDESTRHFIHDLANKHTWSFVDEIMYRSLPGTLRTISIKCIAANPLNFEAREYLTSDDLTECMNDEYSRVPYILEHPPYSEEVILEYETRHSLLSTRSVLGHPIDPTAARGLSTPRRDAGDGGVPKRNGSSIIDETIVYKNDQK
jgi:hypothetical protein